MKEEVNTGISKKMFQDINLHLLNDEKPSEYLDIICKQTEFSVYPFSMLFELKNTEQSKVHHPEGSAWNHTILVVDEAAKRKSQSKNPSVFMWASLLHDIGKPSTTRIRKGRITSYDHDKVGEKLAVSFLSPFVEDTIFIQQVAALVRYHMHILYVVNNLPFSDMDGMLQHTDINEVALLGLCDRLGRTGANIKKEEDTMSLFLKKCQSYQRKGGDRNGKGRNEKT